MPKPMAPGLRQDDRSERLPEVPPAPPPPVPPHLAADTLAVALWDALWAAGAGAYRPETDFLPLERYVTLQARRFRLMRELDSREDGSGWVTIGSQGQEVLHPLAKVLAETEARLLPLEDRLGLNPESRLRLGIAASEGRKSALEAFLDGEEEPADPGDALEV